MSRRIVLVMLLSLAATTSTAGRGQCWWIASAAAFSSSSAITNARTVMSGGRPTFAATASLSFGRIMVTSVGSSSSNDKKKAVQMKKTRRTTFSLHAAGNNNPENDDDEEDVEEKGDVDDATKGLRNATSAAAAVAAVGGDDDTAAVASSGASTNNNNDDKNWLLFVTTVGASTNRGEFATAVQKAAVRDVVSKLEKTASSSSTAVVDATGTWELVYTDTQLFRSSPFFLAGRAVCQTTEEAQRYDWFCDMHRQALSISQILAVRQVITSDSITNEFEVAVGAIPFLRDLTPFTYSGGLPLTITGAIVSTASLTELTDPTMGLPMVWELYMDDVQIKGSNIPLLRQALDLPQVRLSSRSLSKVLENNIANYQTPKPILTTTYLDPQFRITRDQDDHLFVYVRTSNSTAPTDYTNRSADLGVLRLLEGFNDAVTKIYQ
jgi:hypothetical protein